MRIFAATFLLLMSFAVSAQTNDTIPRKKITINRIAEAPKIDGVLDEAIWQDAATATNFVERMPVNGRAIPDSLATDVKIVYDDLGIYFGAVLNDPSPNKIMKELTERDDIGASDFFFILLNGYNDRQQSMQFIVTSAGVQYDAKMTNGMEDSSWNAVWYSDVNITENGWVAEIFIPYSELRFPEKKIQEWGLQMERDFRRAGTRYSWSHVDNKKGSFSIYDGEIHGIKNIETQVRLSFQPYVSSYLTNYAGNTEVNFNGGLDLKYGINDAFTLDMILIPDFGQTKFDEEVLNLSAFEVQYEENRAFFTEGTELFTKGDLFYSRRVGGAPSGRIFLNENEVIEEYPSTVDLLNAVKVSGRTDAGLGIGFFNAITEKTYAKIKSETTGEVRKELIEPVSNYNILVLDQRFGGNSSVSLVNTNTTREGHFRDANATGLYMDLTNKANTMNYFAGAEGSWIMQDETTFGTELQARISKINGKNRFQTGLDLRTENYNINDLGYSSFTNYVMYYAGYNHRLLQPKGFLNNMFLNFNLQHRRRLEPDLFNNFVFNFNSSFTSKNFWNFGGGFETTPFGTKDIYEPRVAERHVEVPAYYDVWLWFSTDNRKKFAFGSVVDWYKFDERGRGNLIIDLDPRYRFSDKFKLFWSTNIVLSDKEEGFVDLVEDEILFGQRDRNTIVNSMSSDYIFNNKMALNLTFRHYYSEVYYSEFYTLQRDGELNYFAPGNEEYDTTYNSWNLDLRFSWWFAPGSQMTLLYRNAITSFANESHLNIGRNFDQLFDQEQLNSLSLRLSYYLDYNRMKNWFGGRKNTPASNTSQDGLSYRKFKEQSFMLP
ncbi:DUF5916 domain-containing protein [Salinimicrobium oceani]|uniref:Carbohydrate binding family 9 domain-containing protein n=1 Tax=Salinimicrobium oceani TaxID=2722702 RepID=A0ABX1CXY5_9FLAO|nr:DUF5916 domain-containing protein [Salinimicrobium oceani]NJW53119.1 carbohydrate binding family 9 domain-containing protein [Salinimicrobium oceani]